MTQGEYEKGLLVATTWRLAKNNDVNELLAIACVLRNWVVPRFGIARQPMNGKLHFESYSEAVQNFLSIYPLRALPAINEPALVDPAEGLLLKIDEVYDCKMIDITSSRSFPGGARYFSRAGHTDNPWFIGEVMQRRDEHPLIGTFGSQQFYG